MVRARKPADATNPSSPSNPLKSVPTGRGYGEAQALQEQMAAVPMPAATSPTPAAAGPARPGAVLDVASQFTPPRVGLGDPTARPGEPVTAGIGEQFGSPAVAPPPDPDVIAMAKFLPMLEMRASQPNASMAMRALVRKLRGALPPDFDFNA